MKDLHFRGTGMKAARLMGNMAPMIIRLILAMGMLVPGVVRATLEQSFDVLQIGTTTYRNVTITTKNKNYIFLVHSAGMASIKVSDLSSDVLEKLGIQDPKVAVVKTNTPTVWAKQTLAKLDTPDVKQVRAQLEGIFGSKTLSRFQAPPLTRNELILAGAALFTLYLFHCYCCLLICRKAAGEPGALIWVPLLQLFPLLKAARMSPWWFVGFLIPGLNLIAQIFWCVRITQARGKTFWVALFLIFPLTSPLAALYLAFSGGRRAGRQNRRVEIMTLEAA
jgi:hypothetical protein